MLEQLAIADAALLCGTSRYARTLSSWAAHYGSPEWRQKNGITKSACAPRDGSEEWSWERLQLCVLYGKRPMGRNPWIVKYDFASDKPAADQLGLQLALALMLRRHPRMRLRIEGHARPQAPAMYGAPLSQARATRMRQLVLAKLFDTISMASRSRIDTQARQMWTTEASVGDDSGVRGAGYSEGGDDFDEVSAFYHRRLVGERVQAEGVWEASEAYARRLAALGQPDGQCVHISIVGLDAPT